MLQLDPSDNLLWRPVVLQDADLDVGVQRCILKDDRLLCVTCRVLVQSTGKYTDGSVKILSQIYFIRQ